jgi:peptidyl-prolyl cis-trans isomerase B (cyclophilin B)
VVGCDRFSTEGEADARKRRKRLEAQLETSKGTILLELLPEDAPVTVANFVNLANRKYYDGVVFHRVIESFMVQGGDPTGTGRGGPGYRFEDEFGSEHKFDRPGVLAMANAGPETNGSQFFITHVPTPHLNNKHTIFGLVKEGQDIVDSVAQGDKIVALKIVGDSAELLEQQKSKIEKWNAIMDSK